MKVVIGYDINEYYAQISYAEEGKEPQTLVFDETKEAGNIETALCRRRDVNQWYYGREAVRKGLSGAGVLIEHIWPLFVAQDTVVIEKQEYPLAQLCQLFIKYTLDMAVQKMQQQLGCEVEIGALVLTAEPWDDGIPEKMRPIMEAVMPPGSGCYFQSHAESLFSYLVHQPERLLGYETGVFDLTGETLVSYRVEMNHKTRPVVTTVNREEVPSLVRKKHYPSIREHDEKLAQLDTDLAAFVQQFTRNRIVTSVYLIGDGFHGDWYPESLKLLCRGRKVFAGNNLFGKGACFSGAERLWPGDVSESFVFFGNEVLRCNVGLMLWQDGKETYFPLLDAGTNWYEANAETEFMMEVPDEIPLLITPVEGGNAYVESLPLHMEPGRELRAYHFTMRVYMQSQKDMLVTVRENGFGDWFGPEGEEQSFHLVLGRVD